jgi:MFS family permease
VSGAGVDRRAMATLSAGHLFTDISQGAIPALLPFLIVKDHLGYAAASALILAATISSSVIQPLFGHMSDRVSLPWLMPVGPALGGLPMPPIGCSLPAGLAEPAAGSSLPDGLVEADAGALAGAEAGALAGADWTGCWLPPGVGVWAGAGQSTQKTFI